MSRKGNIKDNEHRKFTTDAPVGEAWVQVDNQRDPAGHTQAELKTIELLGLTVNNMLTDETGYDIITNNSGEILFAGDVE